MRYFEKMAAGFIQSVGKSLKGILPKNKLTQVQLGRVGTMAGSGVVGGVAGAVAGGEDNRISGALLGTGSGVGLAAAAIFGPKAINSKSIETVKKYFKPKK